MFGRLAERRSHRGFPTIQVVIVFAIVAVVAVVSLPVYAARAKDSVLQQNAQSLALQVKSAVALDLDPVYVPDDGQAAAAVGARTAVSTAIARALRAGEGGVAGRYVNPLSASRAVVCQTALPEAPSETRPAVWITDDQRYTQEAFTPSRTTKDQLGGTLLVVYVTHGGRTSDIDVFYVDAAGQPSPPASSLAL